MALEQIDKDRLKNIIKSRSYRFIQSGINLASGGQSQVYFDMKPSMLDPQGSVLIAESFLEKLQSFDVDYVGGMELGAVPLTAIIVSRSHIIDEPVSGILIRKTAKAHGTMNRIEGLTLEENLIGKRVVVVEDVTSTGTTASEVVDLLQEQGADVVAVMSIIDREQGARQMFTEKNIHFDSIFKLSDFFDTGKQAELVPSLWNYKWWEWQWFY